MKLKFQKTTSLPLETMQLPIIKPHRSFFDIKV